MPQTTDAAGNPTAEALAIQSQCTKLGYAVQLLDNHIGTVAARGVETPYNAELTGDSEVVQELEQTLIKAARYIRHQLSC